MSYGFPLGIQMPCCWCTDSTPCLFQSLLRIKHNTWISINDLHARYIMEISRTVLFSPGPLKWKAICWNIMSHSVVSNITVILLQNSSNFSPKIPKNKGIFHTGFLESHGILGKLMEFCNPNYTHMGLCHILIYWTVKDFLGFLRNIHHAHLSPVPTD